MDEIDTLLFQRLRGTYLAQRFDPDSYENYKSGVRHIRLQFGVCVALNRSDIGVRQALLRPKDQLATWAVVDDGPDAPARFVLAYESYAVDLRPFASCMDDSDLTAAPMVLSMMPDLVHDLWADQDMRNRVAIEM